MSTKIYDEVKKRIDSYDEGDIFFTSDFKDIASLPTIRKYLGRQAKVGAIVRVIDGAYEKPKYSSVLDQNLPVNPEKVVSALAAKYHWTITPCGDVALNKLGLSTQVPAVWSYVSDGPYRDYTWDDIKISFKHKTNREISLMSDISRMVIEALKTLGKDNVNENTISLLKKRLSEEDKKILLEETSDSAVWIYEIIRKVCE